MDTSVRPDLAGVRDASFTLAGPPPRPLGLASNTAFWWNLPISLLLPVAAVYVVLVAPWAVGFVAYQLTLPTFFAGPGAGWTAWWSARQGDLGIDPANGMSASLVSLGVAMVLTGAIGLPAMVRRREEGLR